MDCSAFLNRKIVLIFTSLLLQPGVFAQCYYPGGALARDQYPCDKFAYITLCCPLGYTCFSNGLCAVTDGTIAKSPVNTASRGTCTNPLWNNAICGDFCLNDGSNGSLKTCGNGNWCCSPDVANGACDCQRNIGTFSLAGGLAQTIIGVSSLKSTSTDFNVPSSTSISYPGILSSTSPSSSRSSTSSLASSDAYSSQSSSTTSASSSSPTTSQAVVSETSTSPIIPITHTAAFKAGISVAVVIVVSVILGVAGFCLWRYKQRKLEVESPGPFDDYREAFQVSQGRTSPALFVMQDPHPYQPPVSYTRRGPGQNGDSNVAGRRQLLPPVIDPYQIPYEGT